jgi:transposase
MKKRTYRTKKVNQINWQQLKEQLAGERVVFAIDVAKTKQYALLSQQTNGVSQLLRWKHPKQTREMLHQLEGLSCPIDVVLESTGTYGDPLRYQFAKVGYTIYQASGKRVSDAYEVYDGVPSMHDAKAASIITRLHQDGLTHLWQELSNQERQMNALRREYDLHQSQYQRNQCRLEAYLSRHWPEVTYLLELKSITLENLLREYGSPERITANASEAAIKMKRWGKTGLRQAKIELVLNSAAETLGQPCIEAERLYLQALASEMNHSRLQKKRAKKALQKIIKDDPELKTMGAMLGQVTTAILLSCHLDPRKYYCARAYQKALGLNLKEKSSGRHIGQLKLTKRGSSIARRYLYFTALRLLYNDPWIKAWYEKKVNPRAKNKTVIALMRKLSKALWHVARGEEFDATKLVVLT